jgi:hypothetical protein
MSQRCWERQQRYYGDGPINNRMIGYQKEQRYCDQCGKRLKRGEGSKIGFSVVHGIMKVCNQKCLDKLNGG